MTSGIGRAVLTLSGMGYPLTQVAIRRLDRLGAVPGEGRVRRPARPRPSA